MTIRPAGPEDVPAVAALERALFGVDAWSEGTVREELAGPDRDGVVLEDGGGVVGYAVTRSVGDVVDLQRIAVHPDHRRQGHAARLLTAALDRAARPDRERVLLEVGATNTGALAFYARAGFSEIDRRRRYYRDGTDAVVMQRPLGGAVGDGRG